VASNWDIPTGFVDDALSQWGSAISGDVQSALVTTAPRRTGEFAGTISAQPTAEGVEVESSQIGQFLAEGTPGHPIDSLGPWSLHSAATGEYFGRHVNHPGTGPDPFIENAIDAGEEDWANTLGDIIAEGWSS
jgi:hypothetical protein